MRRIRAWMLAPVVLALAGCSAVPAPDPPATVLRVASEVPPELSVICGTGWIADVIGPGPDTPREAVEALLESYETLLAALPADAPAAVDPDAPYGEGVLQYRSAIRGLAAILREMDAADTSRDSFRLTGHFGGVEIASVNVVTPYGGGYVVDQFGASGFTSDDPSCTAGWPW